MFKRTPLERRVYLRGSVWWFRGYDAENTIYRVSTHQTEKKTAIEVARQIERERAVPSDRAAAARRALTVEGALELLLKHDLRVGARANTVTFHRNSGRHLVRLLNADRPVHDLTIADTNTYTDLRLAEGRGTLKQRHSIQKEIRVLITALNCAKEMNLYAGDTKKLRPKAFAKQKLFYAPGTDWLENGEQCAALLEHTSDSKYGKAKIDRKPHVIAYIHTGVRRDELYLIHPEHVDLDRGVVEVDGTKTDGAKRTVALSTTAREVFKRQLRTARPGRPLFAPWGKCNRDLKANWLRARRALIERARMRAEEAAATAAAEPDYRAAERLDITLPRRLSFNDLRRTFCSLMAAAGVPAHHCADLLGHKSLDMVMSVYKRVAPVSLQAAVDALPALPIGLEVVVNPEAQKRPTRRAQQAARKASRLRAVSVSVQNSLPESSSAEFLEHVGSEISG
jgi:site-specific recombinase XerD